MRAFLLAALLCVPVHAAAQDDDDVVLPYPQRILPLASVTHFESALSPGIGVLWQHALHRPRMVVLSTGDSEVQNPRLYLHLLGSVAYRVAGDDGFDRLRAYAQLGIARRNDSPTFTTTALVAQAALAPRAYGPAARVEIMHNIGVQAGWLFIRDGGNGLFLSVDFMRGLFCDLNLAPGCS